ncbi:hypothetical protein F5887DRAFT_952674 [Amanita rubescens]|nr:hypothetical protein F5887DRAFT_952674 [Amanita rubescens]
MDVVRVTTRNVRFQVADNDLRRLRVSVHTMPPEILSNVFKLGKAMWEDMPFEILVAHVDSHFRKIALNTHFSLPGNSISKVAAYTERSGRHKLDLRIELLHPGFDAKIQQMIRPGLSLNIDEMQNSGLTDAGNPSQSVFGKGAPRLFFVRLRGFALYSFLPPLSAVRILHLDQTKSLALGYSTFQHILSSLSSISKHLICDVCGRAYAGLLLGFNTPALTTLALKGVQEHDLERLWSAGNPPRFSKLERLIFWDCGLLERDWRQVFELFASVTDLSLYSSKTTSTMLQLLAGSDLPWPHLKSLSLIIDLENSEKEIQIREVITARQSGGHPLEVVRLGGNEEGDSYFDGPTRITYFRNPDRWPPNWEFRDSDDNLFL